LFKTIWTTLLLGAASFGPAHAYDGGRYGAVDVVAPTSSPRGIIILFSDGDGLKAAEKTRLDAIAQAGAIAVGVNSAAYFRNLSQAEPGCLSLFSDAETLSRELQREYPTPQYRVPIVAGEGVGGELASRIVQQSPLQTVGGAVAVDPASALPLQRDLCPRPLEADDREGPGTPDAPVLKNPWAVALTPSASPETHEHFAALAAKTKLITLRDLSSDPDPLAFSNLLLPFLARAPTEGVADLPLVEMPAQPHTRRMAVFISGDGGWRDVDKRVSERLQQLGVSVVGWDSLRYFWSRKTPDQAAADLASVLETYERKWNCDEVALIGFSFGADVMPFLYDRLDEESQRRIALISILSPGEAADWEIKVAGWFGAGPSSAATPLAPAVATMPGDRMQCFYGDQDSGRSCELFAARGAEIFQKKGDHHMDGDFDRIGKEIFEGFERRLKSTQ
jgi:type IV secretory pathway VirJ component